MSGAIELLGRTLASVGPSKDLKGVWRWDESATSRGLSMRLFQHQHERDGFWSLVVCHRQRPCDVELCVWSATSPEDAAIKWLESASLETPRLCAMVVDGMAVKS